MSIMHWVAKTPAVSLTAYEIRSVGSGAQLAQIQLTSGGDLNLSATSVTPKQNPSQWNAAKVAGVGDDYEVRATQVSGSPPNVGDVLNTWLSLSAARAWGMSRSAQGSTTGTILVEIRRDTSILASAEQLLDAVVL